MKRRFCVIVALFLTSAAAFAADLVLARDGTALAPIIIPRGDRGVARFAAKELKTYLDRVTGASFEVVTRVPPQGPRIFVGDCAEARDAGLDVAKLKRDGFCRGVKGDDLFLLGRDTKGPWTPRRWRGNEYATLYAVYDFLEDVCGVRWIKAGPYGEVVPKRPTLAVKRTVLKEEPAFLDRRLCQGNLHHYKYPDADKHATKVGRFAEPDRDLWRLRNRYGSYRFAEGCHSTHYLDMARRFAKDHPDWFSLQENGERAIKTPRGAYICFSHPGAVDALARDARAYLSGKPAGSRGLKSWSKSGYGDEFCVDPHDSYTRCQCPRCLKVVNADPSQNYSEVVFAAIAKIADRVKDLKGKAIGTLAYPPKRPVPKTVVIPPNVHVRLCIRGAHDHTLPASRKDQMDLLRRWSANRKGELALWLYPDRAYYQKSLHGAVETSPHATAAFLREAKPYIIGAFFENEAVCQTYRFLDEYVTMKLAWDPDLDIDALLRDYFTSFYGPAAKPIQQIYADLEGFWLKCYSLYGGDRPQFVGRIDLWEKVYTLKELAKLDALVKKAENLAAGDAAYTWRVNLIRDELVGRIRDYREDYEKTLGLAKNTKVACYRSASAPGADGLLPDSAWKAAPTERLGPFRRGKGKPHGLSVLTHYQALWTPGRFHIRIRAQEPDLARSATMLKRKADDPNLWKDNTVEFMLTFYDPSIMSHASYQVLINDRGVFADVTRRLGKSDWAWSSGAVVKVERTAEGYTARASVPFARLGVRDPLKLGPAPFNVVRHRTRRGAAPEYYSWAPIGWSDPTSLGQLTFSPQAPPPSPVNLLKGGGLDRKGRNVRCPLDGWVIGKDSVGHVFVDTETRWDGPAAARIESEDFGSHALLQYIPVDKLKPDTVYRFRCKVKTKDVVPALKGRWPWIHGVSANVSVPGVNIHMPRTAIRGATDWRNIEFTVRTAKDFGKKPVAYVRLFLRSAKGTAWFDEVSFVEAD